MFATYPIEVVSVGDELLDGVVREGNAVFLAERLGDRGLAVRRHTLVRDEDAEIVSALRDVAARGAADCVVSGGLGPTDDDRTAGAAALAMGVGRTRRRDWEEHLEARFAALGRDLLEENRRQSDLPDGASLIWNAHGTAPAFSMSLGGCRFWFLPGVPGEYRPLCEERVVPALALAAAAHAGARPEVRAAVVKTFGLPEAEVGRRCQGLSDAAGGGLWVGWRAAFPEVHVRLRGAAQTVERAVGLLRERLAPAVFGVGDEATFPGAVADALRRAGATLGVAESCTGGLAGKLVTDVAGASDVFLGGLVAYADALKTALCGVREATLLRHGAVSEATARELAAGARERTGATYGLGITGIAGPGGGSADRPVGLVWLAVAGPGPGADGVQAREVRFAGDRGQVRRLSAYAGLEMVRRRALG